MTVPVLQMDPLSLAIWMDPGSLGSGAAPQSGQEALYAAWQGNDFVSAASSYATTEEEAMDGAYHGSCMWHEKRHFFDICLTSYGAWRLRNMFVIGANAWAVAAHASDINEPLVFPMTAYAEPVQRELMGLSEPPENVIKIARDIRARKRSLYDEAKPFRQGDRSLRIDGDAQMEGLALLSQLHCLAKTYGGRAASAIYERHVSRMDQYGLYRWSEAISLYLGCHRERPDGIREIDHEFATAILVAGLCGRWLGEHPDEASFTKPSERMGRLILHFGEGAGHFGMTTEEASQRVDDAALALWGRRLWQELDADMDESRKVGAMLRQEFGGLGEICDAFDDYLDLRNEMLRKVEAAGPSGMSPRAFGAQWADRLRPWLLVAQPAGRWYEPEEGLCVHFGRRFRPPTTSGVAWAWREDDQHADAAIGLRRTAAWNFVIEQAAPLAKLALVGRQHNLMLYPELERIITDFENSNVNVRFAPGFEWPTTRDKSARVHAARVYAELTGVDRFVCDITGDSIAVDEAQLLTAWEFRRSPLAQRFRDKLAGGPVDPELRLQLDWSDWIVRADLTS